jgi:hypothetical protein
MGTSCRIGILYRQAGKIKSVYVHWDGYLKGVGNTLLTYYNQPYSKENLEKIQNIIEGGDLHYFESDKCLEHFTECDNTKSKEDKSYIEYFYRTLDSSSEYYYLYEHGVGWACGTTLNDTPISNCIIKLEDAFLLMHEVEKPTLDGITKTIIDFNNESDIDS